MLPLNPALIFHRTTPQFSLPSHSKPFSTHHIQDCNNKTNWDAFRHIINTHLHLLIPLKTTSVIEDAINTFTKLIQHAYWSSTPEPTNSHQDFNCPLIIKQKLLVKRWIWRLWLRHCTPEVKCQLIKLHVISNNYSQTTLTPTFNNTYKTSLRQPQLNIPCGKQLKN
jgi:hypothetical protein